MTCGWLSGSKMCYCILHVLSWPTQPEQRPRLRAANLICVCSNSFLQPAPLHCSCSGSSCRCIAVHIGWAAAAAASNDTFYRPPLTTGNDAVQQQWRQVSSSAASTCVQRQQGCTAATWRQRLRRACAAESSVHFTCGPCEAQRDGPGAAGTFGAAQLQEVRLRAAAGPVRDTQRRQQCRAVAPALLCSHIAAAAAAAVSISMHACILRMCMRNATR